MNDIYCALCKVRISNWMVANGKIVIVEGHPCHHACLQDHVLRTGQAWVPKKDQ